MGSNIDNRHFDKMFARQQGL